MTSSVQGKKVLVVEDESDIRELILLHLKREGFQVEFVADGVQALEKIKQHDFDLLVLDWMLPSMSGYEITKNVRAFPDLKKKTPILMVTARTESMDLILGLEAGADDYVTKPFEVPVLLARVRALLRRTQIQNEKYEEPSSQSGAIQIGSLEVDLERFTVRCEGNDLSLTKSEFKLLGALIENRGKVLTRDRLIELVQGSGVSVIDRAVDTHIFGLRKKLGACSEFIETVRGVGYRVKMD